MILEDGGVPSPAVFFCKVCCNGKSQRRSAEMFDRFNERVRMEENAARIILMVGRKRLNVNKRNGPGISEENRDETA
jgi:hypothetical protein